MKKIFFILAATLMLASCNKDIEEIKYEFTAKINILDAVRDIKLYDGSDAFPNGKIEQVEGYLFQVRVNFFIYDKDGKLVSEETKIVDDFAQVVTISKTTLQGEYTVVVTSDIVDRNDKLWFWKFEGSSQLSDLKIISNKDVAHVDYYPALGIYKEIINIDKGGDKNISLKPAGAFIIMLFSGLNINSMKYLDYSWDKTNDYYLVNEEKAGLANDYYEYYFLYEVKSNYTGVYTYLYSLPVSGFTLEWKTRNSSGISANRKSTTFDIVRGVNKTIVVDVPSGNVTKSLPPQIEVNRHILSSSMREKVGSQVLEIGKMDLSK